MLGHFLGDKVEVQKSNRLSLSSHHLKIERRRMNHFPSASQLVKDVQLFKSPSFWVTKPVNLNLPLRAPYRPADARVRSGDSPTGYSPTPRGYNSLRNQLPLHSSTSPMLTPTPPAYACSSSIPIRSKSMRCLPFPRRSIHCNRLNNNGNSFSSSDRKRLKRGRKLNSINLRRDGLGRAR